MRCGSCGVHTLNTTEEVVDGKLMWLCGRCRNREEAGGGEE